MAATPRHAWLGALLFAVSWGHCCAVPRIEASGDDVDLIAAQSINIVAPYINFSMPVEGDPEAPVLNVSIMSILARLQSLEAAVQSLEAFRLAAVNASCENGRVMLGINSDGSPLCSAGAVQARLPVTSCPDGQSLRNLMSTSSGCIADNHFVGACPQNTTLSGVTASGRPQCMAVITPTILSASNAALVRQTGLQTERLLNATNPRQTAALIACADQGLTYDVDHDRCQPAFSHLGCAAAVSDRISTCVNRDFGDNCTTYCPYGTTNAVSRSTNFTCNAFAQWVGTPGLCSEVQCPPNSARVDGICTCSRGYFGSVTWNPQNGTFTSTCQIRSCPSSGTPPNNCECPTRYAGRPTWNNSTQRWLTSQSCTPVPCPDGASGAPNCVCGSAFFGTLRFDQGRSVWTGTCTRRISETRCASSGSEGRPVQPQCPNGLNIRRIIYSCYGRYASCGNTNCNCGRTLTTHSRVTSSCVGRSSCRLMAYNSWWGDPCGGWNKPLVIRYECANFR